jgi:hypothetical protein
MRTWLWVLVLVAALAAPACCPRRDVDIECRRRGIFVTGQVVCDKASELVVVTTKPKLRNFGDPVSVTMTASEGRFSGSLWFDAGDYGICEMNCNREPKAVTASLVVSGKVADSVRLDPQHDFEQDEKKDYRLKRTVVLRCGR